MTLLLLVGAAVADPSEVGGIEPGMPTSDVPPFQPVMGGADATPGRWPDAAALYTINGTFGCTGVLVAPDVVLTAGHCGYGLEHAVLGTLDHRSGGEAIAISEAFIHGDPYTTFDVTALVLEAPVTVAPPRSLLLDCLVSDYLDPGAEVAIVGFGATDEWATEWGTILQDARTTITDPDCTELSAGCNEAVSPGGELVAGGGGVDSCSGDSGGPLYLVTREGDFLVGLTSRAALPAPTPCGSGGIYVRADAIAAWVEEVTGRTLPRPDCHGVNRAPAPVADPILAAPGAVGVTTIEPRDPNEGDRHTFEIVTAPAHGAARVYPSGDVTWSGSTSTTFVVRVTDDGGAHADLTIDAVALPARPGARVEPRGGCATTPAPAWSWAPAILVLLGRRRTGTSAR